MQFNEKTYQVGGAVRDMLLDRPVQEIDWVVVGATPQAMLDQGFQQVGKDFPVFLHPETHEEYALARTERKQGSGYYGFEVYAAPDVTLEEDLQRRDLTINAMAMDNHGHIIDPYGGQADLKNRILRHVSPAFAEDPLRVLRTARFAARYHYLGFEIASETLALMRTLSDSGELKTLAKERVWQELQKGLMEASPHIMLIVLRDCGALEALFPDWLHHLDADNLEALARSHDAQLGIEARFAAATRSMSTQAIKILGHACSAPKIVCQLAELYTRIKPLPAATATADTLLTVLEKCDVLRRPELLRTLCQVETLFTQQSYDHLSEAIAIMQSVDSRPFLEQGLTGKELGEAMRSERLARLKQQQE